jgi:hypothetical protein
MLLFGNSPGAWLVTRRQPAVARGGGAAVPRRSLTRGLSASPTPLAIAPPRDAIAGSATPR